MADSSNNEKSFSWGSFLFLPQFRLSFQGFSFIVPVFIRTVALMFEQAGILPPNHPAVQYGMEGIKKYKFSELMGEAWYTLRSKQSSPYQWGLFVSIVLMMAFMIVSFLMAFINVVSVAVGTAQAQIFDNPFGPSDMTTVPSAVNTRMYDMTVPPIGNAQGDYGIMILDKLLRQGIMLKGGPLQNSLGALMQIYNSGVLVIAGIMLFWCVLSVVVDTARTGQIGGGRHNMVWAPIRIVFALGLLIPLGTTGFSSGQIMIIKLAEWGSNFGTRGWVTYVDAVLKNTTGIAIKREPVATMHMLSRYLNMWVCRTAWNGYNFQAGAPVPEQMIRQINGIGLGDQGKQWIDFSNATDHSICGGIAYPSQNEPSIEVALASGDPTAVAMAKFKQAIRAAYARLFVENMPMGTPYTATMPGPDKGLLVPLAKQFACAFVAQHIYGTPTSPLSDISVCGSDGGGQCGAGPAGSGKYPTEPGCLQKMAQLVYDQLDTANTAAFAALDTYTKSPAFLGDMKGRGWAGMGIWYQRIEQLNTTTAVIAENPVTVSEGGGGALEWLDHSRANNLGIDKGAGWGYNKGAGNSEQGRKVWEIMKKYQDWWALIPAEVGMGVNPSTAPLFEGLAAAKKRTQELNQKTFLSIAIEDWWGDITKFTKKISAIVWGYAPVQGIINLIKFNSDPFDFMKGVLNKGIYPLAMLSQVGDMLIEDTMAIYALLAILSFLPTITFAPILMGILGSAAGTFFLCGIVLSMYLPLIPFIRVAHSALTWMISVFEAVAMVPIAALAHLHTEGEGLAGGAKQIWPLWLNLLMRPILTVVGFVGSMIAFNTYVAYFSHAFTLTINVVLDDGSTHFFARMVYAVVYALSIYTGANAIFKMIDLMPNALIKYMGGHADHSFDHSEGMGGWANAASNMITSNMRFSMKARKPEESEMEKMAKRQNERHTKNNPSTTEG